MEGRHAERVGQRESGFGLERAQPLTPSFPLVAPVARSRSCGHGRGREFRSSTFDADERDFGHDDASRLQFGQRCMNSVDTQPTLQATLVQFPHHIAAPSSGSVVTRPHLFFVSVTATLRKQLYVNSSSSLLQALLSNDIRTHTSRLVRKPYPLDLGTT